MGGATWRGAVGSLSLLVMGGFIGAVAAAGADGGHFAPAPWFWPFVWTCLVVALVLAGVWLWLGSADEALHRSDALRIVFEGEGSPCVLEFVAANTLPPAIVTIKISGHLTPEALQGMVERRMAAPHTQLRLHVENLRQRPIREVRVRLREARTVADGAKAYEHSDFLKWMHDDTPDHPASLVGREIRPGNDPDAYIDFATKNHGADSYVFEFAQSHLRNTPIRAVSTYVHLVATGADRQSGREVPDCHAAFRIDVREDGGLSATAQSLEECGFTGRSSSPTISSTVHA